jgi:hypothetical protein
VSQRLPVFFVTEGEEIVLGGGEAMKTELKIGAGVGKLGFSLTDGQQRGNGLILIGASVQGKLCRAFPPKSGFLSVNGDFESTLDQFVRGTQTTYSTSKDGNTDSHNALL